MKLLYSLLLLAIATSRLLCLTEAAANGNGNNVNSETFDYLMLSQEWPYSFCTTTQCKNTEKLQPLFNIHGLWPEHVSGKCEGTFNASELKPLDSLLRQGWMDLTNPLGNPEGFWHREYDKHGKCATVDARFSTTYLYFKVALHLHNGYTLTEMLAKHGITPGPNPVKVSSIKDAMTAEFGYETELSCVSKNQIAYLLELRLCFEKDMSPRNCSSGGRPHKKSEQNGDSTLLFRDTDLYDSSANLGQSQGQRDVVDLQQVGTAGVLKAELNRRLGAEECNPEGAVLLPDRMGY